MPVPPRPAVAPRAPLKSAQRFPWTAVGIFLAVGLFVYFAWLWLAVGEPVGAAILLGPILVILTVPLFLRAGRANPGFDIAGVLLIGLLIRFGFAYYRFDNAVDALNYHAQGVRLGDAYRNLDFSPDVGTVPGTGGLNAISGGVHALVGNDFFASFLVMAWLSFFGCWFLYRAFEISIGDGDRYRYARLIMLWPSMAFWPSSLGKDAWMVFTIGLASYGAARVYRRMSGGYTWVAIGLVAASFVRPHLALLAVLAFVIALVIGRRTSARANVTPGFLAKVVGVGLIIVLGSVLVSRTLRVLEIEDFSSSSIDTVATTVNTRTTEGGSAFDAANPRSPTGFPQAAITVLFRPLPHEAIGLEQIGTSLEGMFLIVLTVASVRRLVTIPRRLRSQPYLLYALIYVLLWILAFGIIGNFGILARQRTQMLPFYFALLSVPAVVATPRPSPIQTRPQPLR